MKEVREEVLKKRFEKKADITDSPELRDSIREVITLNKRFANFSDKKLVQGAWNFMSQELRVT
ncbi:MAG: hypothetical protein LBQ24_06510 [Candidatus Peribacteria bacterium]|jgi:hypothetical protein|nr:hypothetical protein [Candidatus Peribacteria bacterium]